MKKYICSYESCTKSFNRPAYLQEHMNVHLNIKPFTCTSCETSYFKKRHLKRHLLTHSDKKYNCIKCNLAFCEKYLLHNHLKLCDIKYECGCGKIYKRKKVYQNHKTHCEGVKIIKDEKISKELKIKGTVVQKKKPLNDSLNVKNFTGEKANIIRKALDIIKEDDKKKFRCKYCDKEYINVSNFFIHFRTYHLNLRDYECKCGKSYKYNRNLKIHNRNCKIN